MSGYSSDLNIRLGQMPEIKDQPQVFTELQQVYNAIHLLNAALNDVRRNFADVARDTPPWESFTFEGRSFWAPAANNIKAGDLVRMSGAQWVRGVTGKRVTLGRGTKLHCSGTGSGGVAYYEDEVQYLTGEFAFCLEETDNGLAHIGWPDAIVEVSGISVGELAYGRSADGKIYSNRPSTDFYPIGRIVAPDALMLMNRMELTATSRRYVNWWRECGGGGGG